MSKKLSEIKLQIKRVKQAIEDIKSGKMVIMIDDEDRENEGDLVYAGTFSTPEKVNFMATYAKGLICVSVSKEISDRLQLSPMVKDNNSQHETAFTVTVDAKECTTGISAYERDMTIKVLSDYNSKPSDLVKPGHIFPLIAKNGGVLVRTGHTEGSVDLCKMAGLTQVAVICEIMKDDGTMARRSDLEKFAKKHDLNIVYISDLVEYRLQNESLIREIAEARVKFMDSDAKRIDFVDHKESHHIAYQFGILRETTNVRFHNIGLDIELLSNEKKYNNLIKSIRFLQKNGGVLIFLEKEENRNPYMKEYGIGAQILKELKVKNIRLLVGKKGVEFVGLSGFGLNVVEEIEID